MRIHPLLPLLIGRFLVFGMFCGLFFSPFSLKAEEKSTLSQESASPKQPQIDSMQIVREKLDFANGLFQREFYDMALVEYQALIVEYAKFSSGTGSVVEPQMVSTIEQTVVPIEAAVVPVQEEAATSTEKIVEPVQGVAASAEGGVVLPEANVSSDQNIIVSTETVVAFLEVATASVADPQPAVWAGIIYIEEAYIGAAESLFFLKRYKEALLRYRSVLGTFPQTSQRAIITVRIGQCLYSLQKYERARQVFEKLDAGQLPEDLKLTYLFYYGEALKAVKQYVKSRDALEQLVRISDSGEQAWLSFLELAEIEALLKNSAKANEWFDRAFEKADSDIWKSRVLYRKGKAQFESGQYADALKTFQMLLDKFPDQLMARFLNFPLAKFINNPLLKKCLENNATLSKHELSSVRTVQIDTKKLNIFSKKSTMRAVARSLGSKLSDLYTS